MMKEIKVDDVPAIGIIRSKLKEIEPSITVEAAGSEFDTGDYALILRLGERESQVRFSREFLDDLRDNPSGPRAKYSRELNERLRMTLLEGIERDGLLSYNESNLKFLLLKYICEETKQSRIVHKYNAIGRTGQGSFEQWLRKTLRPEEKETLIWAWDELRRLRLITPTGKDSVNPDDWVRATEKGLAAIEGRQYVDYVEGETFINKGEVYTAYTKIRAILKQARRELFIIDPHVNAEIIEMLSSLTPTIKVRLLGTFLHGDFELAYRKFQKERGGIEVRRSNYFHDRFIIVDGTVTYQLGGSIMDAGAKATVIDRKEDSTTTRLLEEAEKVWTGSPAL